MVMIIFCDKKSKQAKAVRLAKYKNLAQHDEWRSLGKKLVQDYAEESHLAVSGADEKYVMSLAFGVELGAYSFDKYECKMPQDYLQLETVEFVVEHPEELKRDYKAYAALANAVRYSRDLFNEPEDKFSTRDMSLEIKRLEYLNLKFAELNISAVSLEWKNSPENKEIMIYSPCRKNSAIAAGIAKAAALQHLPLNLKVFLNLENNHGLVNDLLVENAIYINDEFNNDEEAEAKLLLIYHKIIEGFTQWRLIKDYASWPKIF